MLPPVKVLFSTSTDRIVIYCRENLIGLVGSMRAAHESGAGANDVKILLGLDDLPKAWYNIVPDLPVPLPPPLHPGTKQPITPADLPPIIPNEILRQEMAAAPMEPIPEEVREAYYRIGRPTPMYRATRLEAYLKTPA